MTIRYYLGFPVYSAATLEETVRELENYSAATEKDIQSF
jgi:hypothetical protein